MAAKTPKSEASEKTPARKAPVKKATALQPQVEAAEAKPATDAPKAAPVKASRAKTASAKTTPTKVTATDIAPVVKSAAAQKAAKADSTNAEARKTFWATSGYKGISRIDHARRNTHGWYVRISFGGTMHSKFFSDSVHGGSQKALSKAVKHRNQTEKEIGKPRTDRVISAAKARNKTGILGVQRINKGAAGAWQVTWSPAPGVLQRTSVSVAKYGEEEAFKRACRIRRQKEKAVFGGVISREEVSLPTQIGDMPTEA